jgi:hypothetical protein
MRARFWKFVHNVIAHPMLEVWPRAGEWIHGWTGKRM